jgi:PAS domain S-box-containing protein
MTEYWFAARALSAVMFAFALYVFLIWARRPERKPFLAMAFLLADMGLYDLFISMVYASPSALESIPWLRLASAADSAAVPLFLWYLTAYTRLVRARELAICAAAFGLLAAALLFAPGDLAWIASAPFSFEVTLPAIGAIAFHQVKAGPLEAICLLAGLPFLAYFLSVIRKFAALGHKGEARGLALALATVFLALVNDSLVDAGIYRFLYLTEYAWALALVFLVYRSLQELMSKAEEAGALAASEARLRAMVEHMPFNIWMCDAAGRLIMQNASDVSTVGDHVGETYEQWAKGDSKAVAFAEFSRRALGGEVVDQAMSYKIAGLEKTYRDIIAPALSNGRVIGTVGIGIDITEMVTVERELKSRLTEKEVLLREIHHRVKNNLQVIASLLSLRADELSDPQSKEAFQNVQREVRAISHVHESLYLSDNVAAIDFSEYLRSLAHELLGIRAGPGIETAFELDSLFFEIETAIPCALIANELITNSLKHAMRGRKTGLVTISLRSTGERRAVMAVEDDGEGIPEGVFAGGGSSIGMLLVSSLATQLRGRVAIGGPRRSRVEVIFPY